MPDRFPADVRQLLADAEEIEIETAAEEAAARHRTVIWVVLDDDGRVLVRSVRGGAGRWFREALTNPRVTIRVDGRSVPATAVVAADEERIERASRGFRAKYGSSPSMASMLEEEVLATTLELVPR